MNVSLLSQKLLQNNLLSKKLLFLEFCSLEVKPLILGEIRGHISERALKESLNALLRGVEALLVPELCANLKKNVKNGKI